MAQLPDRVEKFKAEREQLNEIVLSYAGVETKRFFSLDGQVYREGALPKKVKELLGLVASVVLRCDDCILYHLIQCYGEGVTDGELQEALSVALIVGGSITIPHLRRAYRAWDEMRTGAESLRGKGRRRIGMTSKTDMFSLLLEDVAAIVVGDGANEEKALNVCALLRDRVPYYDWVGFYLVDPNAERELVLGPFVGDPTEHTRIAFGKGICGQAAETGQPFVVQDVSQETNYLACSVHVKSEIVVPMFKAGALIGELDIDSHTLAPFTEEDEAFLKAVCDAAAKLF